MIKCKRKWHYLKGNDKCESPAKHIFFDTEARLTERGDVTDHTHILTVACYVNRAKQVEVWESFTDSAAFWHWVGERVYPKERLYVWAHNASYDAINSDALGALTNLGFTITSWYSKQRVFIVQLARGHVDPETGGRKAGKQGTIVLVSSGNIYQSSLADMGKVFGLPKMEHPDFRNATARELLPYCRRDVEILKRAMLGWLEFVADEDLGNFAKTISSQAFAAFRHRFMEYPILIHGDQKAADLERNGYYGGRVECWRIGEFRGEFIGLDVNSMYPYVMQAKEYPTKLSEYVSKSRGVNCQFASVEYLKRQRARGRLLMARVKVSTAEPFYPYRTPEGRVLFPIGTFTTVLSTPEIDNALSRGEVIDVLEATSYESAPLFQAYVDYFWDKRLGAKREGNEVNSLLYKYMLNTLYGKFGQYGGSWDYVGETNQPGIGETEYIDAETGQVFRQWFMYGQVFQKADDTEAFNGFCGIAAHVTAYARMHLYTLALIAGRGNVLYMDTDSLFVTTEGADNLTRAGWLDDRKLGYLKREVTADSIAIRCPKDYTFGGKVKLKGVPRGGARLAPDATAEEIARAKVDNQAVWVGEDTVIVNFWPKMGTLVRGGEFAHYYNIWRKKHLNRVYNKGAVYPGGAVGPIVLDNGVVLVDPTCLNPGEVGGKCPISVLPT